MATLTMQPIGPSPAPTASKEPRGGKGSGEDGADLGDSDIDSGWVVVKNSDIVPAELAAGSSPKIPTWARWVLGGVVCTVVPLYKRLRHVEDEAVGAVENAVEVVEHVAEVTEKLAANLADQLPEDGSLQKVVEEVEHIAEVVDSDTEKVEAIVEKVDTVSDELDAAVEPVIDELEKELDQSPTSGGESSTSGGGANTPN